MLDAFLYALQISLTNVFGHKIASQVTKSIQNIVKSIQSFGKIVGSVGKTVFSGIVNAFKLLVKYGTEVSAALKGIAVVFGILLGYSALIGILTGIGAALALMLSPIGSIDCCRCCTWTCVAEKFSRHSGPRCRTRGYIRASDGSV